MDVIPSHYRRLATIGQDPNYDPGHNAILRPGEVQRVVYPEDPDSLTKRFIEYDVLVQHAENGTAVTKMYHNCFLANDLAGLADKSVKILRSEAVSDPSILGDGCKVLVLCVNGAASQPVILSGIRDERDSDLGRKAKGIHMEWEYNGVHVEIQDDGGYSVEYKGPTDAKGELDESRKGSTDTAGTVVKVENNGNFTVQTKEGNQSLVISHADKTITVTGDKDVTVRAKTIHLGDSAGEHAVMGDTHMRLMKRMLQAIQHLTVTYSMGPTSIPINAAEFAAIEAEWETCLSHQTFVKRDP